MTILRQEPGLHVRDFVMTDKDSSVRLDLRKLTITSLVFGFFLVPVHELGHVICDWVTGHPAGMSYARDYLLSGGEPSFLGGVLGGPCLPIIVAAASVVFIYRGTDLSLFYPVAIQASVERLVPYVCGMLPSDERDLARLAGWNMYSFKHIFLSLELLLLGLIVISLFKHKVGAKQSVLSFGIALVCLVVSAGIGICVVERFVFPEQFKIQFGS